MGEFSVTGTTVKSEDKLPNNLVADEKHTRVKGEKAYITTTVLNECFLHAILGIRNVATKKTQPLFQEILNREWNIYKTPSLCSFFSLYYQKI